MLTAEAEIASIGLPIGNNPGIIRTSSTWSLLDDAFTPRQELCISADGVGIRLFSLNTRRPLFNYILPADVQLTCPTLSFVYQNDGDVDTRYTFCTTSTQLFKFENSLNQDAASRITPSLSPLPDAITNPQFILPFLQHGAHTQRATPGVIVADAVGNLMGVPIEDGHLLSTGRINNVDGQILDLHSLSYSQLQRGLLSSRQDILVNIDSSATYLAALMYDKSSSILHLKLWGLRTSSTSIVATSVQGVHLSLSTQSFGDLSLAKFSRGATNIICVTFPNQVVLWNPSEGSTLMVKNDQEILSACAVNDDKVLLSTVRSLILMEMAYGSTLGMLQLGGAMTEGRDQDVCLNFFDSTTGAAVAQRGRSSLLIDSAMFPELKRSSASIVLADIVGKPRPYRTLLSSSDTQENDQLGLRKLDEILKIDDINVLDDSLKLLLAGESAGKTKKERKRKRDAGPVSNTVVKALLSWMFKMSESGRLSVRRLPPRTFAWLAGRGLMSQELILSSLRDSSINPGVQEMSQTAFLDCLMAHAPSIGLLRYVVLGKNKLDLREMSYLLHYLVCASFDHTSPETPTLLTNGHSGEDVAHQEAIDASTLEQLASLVCLEMDRYDLGSLRATMSSTLEIDELYNIIHYLRIRLLHGGWFSACYENHGAVAKSGDGNLFSAMVKVFTSTIDAIGHRGGFHGSIAFKDGVPNDEDAKVVRYMRAEIATALQGVEDSTTLSKFLSEFCDYVSTLKPSALSNESSLTSTSTSSREQNLLPLSIQNRKQSKPISRREKKYLKHKSLGQYSFDKIRL